MGIRSVSLLLLLVLAGFALAGCKQPTSDPDQALRDLIVNKTWYPDTSFTDSNPAIFYYYSDGNVTVGGKAGICTWSILNGALTLVWADGTASDVTTGVALTSTTLVLEYLGTTVHLTTIPTP